MPWSLKRRIQAETVGREQPNSAAMTGAERSSAAARAMRARSTSRTGAVRGWSRVVRASCSSEVTKRSVTRAAMGEVSSEIPPSTCKSPAGCTT
jgi:hypothetical protein